MEIEGSRAFINSDVKTCMKIIELLATKDSEKLGKAIALFFKEDWQHHIDEASVKAMTEFIFKKMDDFEYEENKKVLDLNKDFDAIYSAILRLYKIDIIEEKVHWWKFLLMLSDLSEELSLVHRVKIRSTKLGDIKDPNTRSQVAREQKRLRLDKALSLEERNRKWAGG